MSYFEFPDNSKPFKTPQELISAAAAGKFIRDLRTKEVLKLEKDGYFSRTNGEHVTVQFFDFHFYELYVEPPKPREWVLAIAGKDTLGNLYPGVILDTECVQEPEENIEFIKVREVFE